MANLQIHIYIVRMILNRQIDMFVAEIVVLVRSNQLLDMSVRNFLCNTAANIHQQIWFQIIHI